MAFRDFHYPDLITQLGLTETTEPNLFADVIRVPPGPLLAASLPVGGRLGPSAHSEFSRAIWMVGPVLADVWNRYQGRVCLVAGGELNADPEAGLNGVCDFILGPGPQRPVVSAPILLVFEAKRDSIPDGLAQCIAALVGAQRLNRRHNLDRPVFGCVTTGSLWRFMRLSGTQLALDLREYAFHEADLILGILLRILGPVPESAAA